MRLVLFVTPALAAVFSAQLAWAFPELGKKKMDEPHWEHDAVHEDIDHSAAGAYLDDMMHPEKVDAQISKGLRKTSTESLTLFEPQASADYSKPTFPAPRGSDEGINILPYVTNDNFAIRFPVEESNSRGEVTSHMETWTASDVVHRARISSSRELMERVDILAYAGGIAGAKLPKVYVTRIVNYSKQSHTITFNPGLDADPVTLTYPADSAFSYDMQLRNLFRFSKSVLLEGDPLPAELMKDLDIVNSRVVQRARMSANTTWHSISAAVRKGDQKFLSQGYEIQNALPNATGLGLPIMLQHMNLDWGMSASIAWRGVAKELEARSNDIMAAAQTATRQSLMNALAHGSKDVLVLFAHNAESKVYFPDGKTLSFAEMASIKRETAPDRSIILITCNSGGTRGATLSLAETFIANKLALTVFASEGPVLAEDVPRILDELKLQGIRGAMRKFRFQQMVDLRLEESAKG